MSHHEPRRPNSADAFQPAPAEHGPRPGDPLPDGALSGSTPGGLVPAGPSAANPVAANPNAANSSAANLAAARPAEPTPSELLELEAVIAELPPEYRIRLVRATESLKKTTLRRRRILTLVQDALSQLRLDMKYLMFDLEATRRERDALKRSDE